MELNREQIIKALECCLESEYCATCPATGFCGDMDTLMENAFYLIKELTEEVADLKAIAEQYQKQFEEAKADTLQELQNRLTQCIGTYTNKSFVYVDAWFALIDQIAKEMLEEGQNEKG